MDATEQIIERAKQHQEPVWHWGIAIRNNEAIRDMADTLNLELLWGEPIRPGDTYLATRNSLQLLTCKFLGVACVHPVESAYSFDFSECVKVKDKD